MENTQEIENCIERISVQQTSEDQTELMIIIVRIVCANKVNI